MSDAERFPPRIWVSDSDSILGLEVLQVENPEGVAEHEPGVYAEYVRADRIEQYRDARRAEAIAAWMRENRDQSDSEADAIKDILEAAYQDLR